MNMTISGYDARAERHGDYVFYLWLCGGLGAPGPSVRDNGTYLTPLAAGTSLQSIESLEREYPVLFHAFEFITDSEGAGYHRGGFGVRPARSLSPTQMRWSQPWETRERLRPWGAAGGGETAVR